MASRRSLIEYGYRLHIVVFWCYTGKITPLMVTALLANDNGHKREEPGSQIAVEINKVDYDINHANRDLDGPPVVNMP
ncbi:uncharacterized protein LAESUDRAFT_730933 [Laetiporus sulphureus 93-53]|uniref:Uncharacterized protein n=1 Tax=Laetiporus sulphureus 93-53 TaxID=1314785 RepID=A0A165BTX2_9APHY|nr:uncharacterized protein LAESUDRAFT_730933 [Laetiporus sulphureus 93-53]KZT01643.1 hypothetical protein LAESUDRAFT_730933 [Laetiporus sulphureus 93-53]